MKTHIQQINKKKIGNLFETSYLGTFYWQKKTFYIFKIIHFSKYFKSRTKKCVSSFLSTFENLYDFWVVRSWHDVAHKLSFLHDIIEFLVALLNLFDQLSIFPYRSKVIVLVPLLFELSILVFQVLDLFLKRPYHNVFLLEFFLEEDIVDFVTLLYYD